VNACLDNQEGEVDFAVRDVRSGIISSDTDNSDLPVDDTEVIKVRTTTLERVLKQNGAPDVIDYLSIDIEGAEERILATFDFDATRFNCITIERPSPLLREIFAKNGYRLVKEIPELDCFYVHEGFMPDYQRNLYLYYDKKHIFLRWK
jgi:hypothetical protein